MRNAVVEWQAEKQTENEEEEEEEEKSIFWKEAWKR